VDASLLNEEAEIALSERMGDVAGLISGAIAHDEFEAAGTAAATLRKPVDDFFEKVTVNADAPEIRVNRLRLLSKIRNSLDQLADLSKIEG
jgi:glycyl-tRNA synthetase beta chain